MRTLMGYVPKRYDMRIVEALALVGGFAPELVDDRAGQCRIATTLAGWLNATTEEKGWSVEVAEDGGYVLRQVLRGVTDAYMIDRALLASAEARKLHTLAAEEAGAYAAPAKLGDRQITRPGELLDAVLEAGRKGLSIQRYKGLGEMNAEQLWETTLDPQNRALLRVEVAQADIADELFTRLMGDVVEPRREFIQDNALSVANLDV
jgi:DNA gyrase subunit B